MITIRSILMVCIMALGACTNHDLDRRTAPGSAWPDNRFAPDVYAVTMRHAIPLRRPDPRLDTEADTQFAQFLHAYKTRGTGQITITAPGARQTVEESSVLLGEINRVLYKAGIDTTKVLVQSAEPGDPHTNGHVSLHFIGYVAKPKRCGHWVHDNIVQTGRTARSENLGCAMAHNLAAMVSHPRDLIEPRGSDPAPTSRRKTVYDAYVKGKPTGAERRSDESGAVSKVNR